MRRAVKTENKTSDIIQMMMMIMMMTMMMMVMVVTTAMYLCAANLRSFHPPPCYSWARHHSCRLSGCRQTSSHNDTRPRCSLRMRTTHQSKLPSRRR